MQLRKLFLRLTRNGCLDTLKCSIKLWMFIHNLKLYPKSTSASGESAPFVTPALSKHRLLLPMSLYLGAIVFTSDFRQTPVTEPILSQSKRADEERQAWQVEEAAGGKENSRARSGVGEFGRGSRSNNAAFGSPTT